MEQKLNDLINGQPSRFKKVQGFLREAQQELRKQNPCLAGWHLCHAADVLQKDDKLAAEVLFKLVLDAQSN